MNAYEAIKTRRSSRNFKPDDVEDSLIEKIITAGRFAPCGGNSQTTHFIVIRNKQVLNEIAEIACDEFAKMEVTPNMYKSLKAVIAASKKGGFVFHYNAPVLIVTANKIGYDNAMADCACAIENMMIEANELNLGSTWINQLHWLDNNERIRKYMLKLGLKEDETICASMALGRPNTQDNMPVRTERNITGNPVTYIN